MSRYLNFLHLSAVQGSREARTELYIDVLRGSTVAADEVIHQELWRSFVLRAKSRPKRWGSLRWAKK